MNGAAAFGTEDLVGQLGGREIADMACPVCSPYRKPVNRRKPVLRLWRVADRLISYHCVHCEASGLAGRAASFSALIRETGRGQDASAMPGRPRRLRAGVSGHGPSMRAASRSKARWAKPISASIARSPATCPQRWGSCPAMGATLRPS